MEVDTVSLGRRVRQARDAAGTSPSDAAKTLGISQLTYSRIETGERPMKGDELVTLADLFGVRAAAITGVEQVSRRAKSAVRTDDAAAPAAAPAAMRERLYAYLELDSYLTDQGIA